MSKSNLHLILSQIYNDCLLGLVGQASDAIQELRKFVRISECPSVAAETMLLEGIVSIYRGEIDRARERLARAVLIGEQFQSLDIAPVARGWLALVAYNEGDVLSAAKHLLDAVPQISARSPRARLRLATTTANLAFYAGLTEEAKAWNAASRRAAAAMGLAGVLTSVAFSMAVASLDDCQRRRLTGKLRTSDAAGAFQAVQSAMNYDASAGNGAQPMLHRLALGMALNLCSRFEEAKVPLREYVLAATGSRVEDLACGLVELAVAELGSSDAALDPELLSQVQAMESVLREPLERAALFSALGEHYQRVGDLALSEIYVSSKCAAMKGRDDLSLKLCDIFENSCLVGPPLEWVQ